MDWAKVTDKVEPHGYFKSYLEMAADIGPYGNVCEVGIAGGGGLVMLQQLFPFGIVCGVDNCSPPHAAVTQQFWPEGTKKVESDQDNPELPGLLRKISPYWSMIIDDASHEGPLTTRTFELLWPLVAPGGYYVVEDWTGAFQNDRQPGSPYSWGPGLLVAVKDFLELLWDKDAECDEIVYRYGLAMIHRRA